MALPQIQLNNQKLHDFYRVSSDDRLQYETRSSHFHYSSSIQRPVIVYTVTTVACRGLVMPGINCLIVRPLPNCQVLKNVTKTDI